MLEQIFQQNICQCGHSLEEHSLGTCYAIDLLGGNYWKACDCSSIKIQKFSINTNISEQSYESNSTIANQSANENRGANSDL